MDNSQSRHLVGVTEAYKRAYTAVLNNPYWFSDRPRLLDEKFNAENTGKRAECVVNILRRAGRRRSERHLVEEYLCVADKLAACQRTRCGSSSCLNCLRAFQQAKSVAHRKAILQLSAAHPNVLWCVATIIPLELNYPPSYLDEFDPREFNHHLIERLASDGLTTPFLGSADLSLETSAVGKYWQPHWHFTLHTRDPEMLRERFKDLFPPIDKYDYPVKIQTAYNLDYLPYIHKVIKINDLLRCGRRELPAIVLKLDRINPLDLLAHQGLVLSAQSGGFKFELLD